MPRAGGEPQVSDNSVEGHDIIHGGSKTTDQVDVSHSDKVAPLPEGLKEEVKDGVHSGGGSGVNPPFHGSGKGGEDPTKK